MFSAAYYSRTRRAAPSSRNVRTRKLRRREPIGALSTPRPNQSPPPPENVPNISIGIRDYFFFFFYRV